MIDSGIYYAYLCLIYWVCLKMAAPKISWVESWFILIHQIFHLKRHIKFWWHSDPFCKAICWDYHPGFHEQFRSKNQAVHGMIEEFEDNVTGNWFAEKCSTEHSRIDVHSPGRLYLWHPFSCWRRWTELAMVKARGKTLSISFNKINKHHRLSHLITVIHESSLIVYHLGLFRGPLEFIIPFVEV